MMNKLLGKLVCAVKGHRRGKRIIDPADRGLPHYTGYSSFRCPRCGATWTRKVKA